jgi:glyoxylase-like metal-dependent hydrolase (beta-lactamase superfamily II)
MRKFIGALLIAGACIGAAPLPSADYDLIPGTFEKGRQPDGNSIVIDAPRGLIVFDTGRHSAQQDRILAAARARGKPIAAIVNSHWHLDHSGGNQELRAVYPKARIIASNAVVGALAGFLKESRKGAEAYIASGEPSPQQQAEIRGDFAAMDDTADLIPTDPVVKSERRSVAGRPLELHLAKYAATEGDVWVYDPGTRTVLAGDLVVAFAPFMDTGCVPGWLAALDEIERTPFTTLIPGHGAPMDRADFRQWKTAFRNLVDCGASKASNDECIAGWNRDAARFVAPLAPRKIDPMIAYYLDNWLRPGAPNAAKYCPPAAASAAQPERG